MAAHPSETFGRCIRPSDSPGPQTECRVTHEWSYRKVSFFCVGFSANTKKGGHAVLQDRSRTDTQGWKLQQQISHKTTQAAATAGRRVRAQLMRRQKEELNRIKSPCFCPTNLFYLGERERPQS